MLFNIDEKQLMLELKNKDERALKICMNKYYRYVVYIVENIIGSALPYEDKEAVVSNVFVALWNYSADLDTDNYSTFKPYLGTIARNMAKNALRKTSKMHFENYEDAFQVGTNEHIEYGPLKEEVINGKGWELTDKDNIVISFDKYKSDITVSQDLIIGYVKDGIMYVGEVFDELSGKYSFSPDEKGEYFFYLLSGSSDYLSLKSGNLEVN